MDLPRNSTALAEESAKLSNAIVESTTEALHEGRILLERVGREDSGANGVRQKVTKFLLSIITHYFKNSIYEFY